MKSLLFLVALMTAAFVGRSSAIMVDYPSEWQTPNFEDFMKKVSECVNLNNRGERALKADYAPPTQRVYTDKAVGSFTPYPDNIIQEYE
ncbi:unnamed protein product [Candidula unifasciata]|uniref:Uncharacterized protein n=1 Tax=Candidula unifasciata TaxID=100452 RepID=A0A8S3ZRJ5_9EUPU|nr:unnamed protein product [Candidula unifasciata]